MRTVHDNSSAYRHIPDPLNWVRSGELTIDEMTMGQADWIWLTQDEYEREVAKQDGQPNPV